MTTYIKAFSAFHILHLFGFLKKLFPQLKKGDKKKYSLCLANVKHVVEPNDIFLQNIFSETVSLEGWSYSEKASRNKHTYYIVLLVCFFFFIGLFLKTVLTMRVCFPFYQGR